MLDSAPDLSSALDPLDYAPKSLDFTPSLETLANLGLLSRFVGMLTDSRSFLSFPRHEYFRRILCNLLGIWMKDGFVPNEPEMIGDLVKRICYSNAREYLKLGE